MKVLLRAAKTRIVFHKWQNYWRFFTRSKITDVLSLAAKSRTVNKVYKKPPRPCTIVFFSYPSPLSFFFFFSAHLQPKPLSPFLLYLHSYFPFLLTPSFTLTFPYTTLLWFPFLLFFSFFHFLFPYTSTARHALSFPYLSYPSFLSYSSSSSSSSFPFICTSLPSLHILPHSVVSSISSYTPSLSIPSLLHSPLSRPFPFFPLLPLFISNFPLPPLYLVLSPFPLLPLFLFLFPFPFLPLSLVLPLSSPSTVPFLTPFPLPPSGTLRSTGRDFPIR